LTVGFLKSNHDKRKMKKHNLYYDLLEALGEEGCPICMESRSASKKYLSSILTNGVNDPELRRKLRGSLGFCSLHAREFRDLGDSLATAIIYKDVVDTLLEDAEEKNEQKRRCPACDSVDAAEKDYIAAFIKYLSDAKLMEKYDSSSGLCHPHLMTALKMIKRGAKSADIILEKENDKLRELWGELAEFIRKKDYRYAHEIYGKERDSWIRAVEKISGTQR